MKFILPFFFALTPFQFLLAQSWAFEITNNSEAKHSINASLDQSQLINANYTTFLQYTLTGTTADASICVTDCHGNTVKVFPIAAEVDGAIELPANLFHEGNYHLQMIVSGKIQDEHDLRVVR